MADAADPVGEGRYQLTDVLGSGGMATVYRAWDTRLKVWRAVKVLAANAAKNADLLARFETEAHTMARLRHPNLLAVHDVGRDGARPWLVMDLAPGGSVHEKLRARGKLAAKRAAEVVIAALAGLQYAHEHGVVHRDVKPHNLLIDAHGTITVADFGIARMLDLESSATRTGTTLGTLAYMAPEQRTRARDVDARADVYAAGATLVALLRGREPYDLHVDTALEEQLVGVPIALARVIRKATRYEPAARWESAAAMRSALIDALPLMPSPTDPSLSPDQTGDWHLAASAADTFTDEPPTAPPPAPPTAGRATWEADPDAVVGAPPPVSPVPPAQELSAVPREFRVTPIRAVVTLAALAALVVVPQLARRTPAPEWSERAVTAFPADDPALASAMSADGSRLAWVTADGLWTQDVDGVAPTLTPCAPVRTLTAAGDGWVGGRPTGELVRLRDGAETVLGTGRSPTVAPDGAIAYVDGGVIRLARDGDLAHATALFTIPDGEGLARLQWSPDGKALGAALRSGTAVRVVELSPDDGAIRGTVAVPGAPLMGAETSFAWEDADHIALTWRDPATRDTVLGRAAFGEAPVETHRWTEPMALPMSVGGGRMLVYRGAVQQDVWASRTDAVAMKRITRDDHLDALPAFLPDGRVVFVSDRSGRPDLWTQAPDGVAAQPVGGSEARRTMPVPAGTGLLWSEVDGDAVVLMRDGVSVFSAKDPVHASCSRDGAACVAEVDGKLLGFGSTLGELDVHDFVTGAFDVSPDGSELLVGRLDGRLDRIALAGGATSSIAVTGLLHLIDVAWTADGVGAWVLGGTRAAIVLARCDPSGCATVWSSESLGGANDLAVSPDGEWIAFTGLAVDADLWLVDPYP
jgi:tRNA A-37 threonylcarbamoyl transferase component Bud32